MIGEIFTGPARSGMTHSLVSGYWLSAAEIGARERAELERKKIDALFTAFYFHIRSPWRKRMSKRARR